MFPTTREKTTGELAFIRFLQRCPVTVSECCPLRRVVVYVGGGVHPTIIIGHPVIAEAIAIGQLDGLEVCKVERDEPREAA